MSAQHPISATTDTLHKVRAFLREERSATPRLAREERAKVKDLCADVRRLVGAAWFPMAAGFGRVFSGFERLSSMLAHRTHRMRLLPALDDTAMKAARPRAFADDYATFDRLSVLYGGLFRGSVIVNYLLGVVAVGLTLASILPQPHFLSSSGEPIIPDFAWYAVRIEMACIVIIGAIFCYGQTPHRGPAPRESGWRRRLTLGRLAHRWHERWLEYRVLAERFRYLELMLSLSSSAALERPFAAPEGDTGRWYDRYFIWRTRQARPADMEVRVYRERALALMLEQIAHHDATSARRGAIAARLHRCAVWLFFASLVFCLVDLIVESSGKSCQALRDPASWCYAVAFFNENLKSLVEFSAIMAPVLAAAIHGVLATTEYTKIAESSRQTADQIASLVATIVAFPPTNEPAAPATLKPIQDAIAAFADATINEASGWRATLRDKNIPLA